MPTWFQSVPASNHDFVVYLANAVAHVEDMARNYGQRVHILLFLTRDGNLAFATWFGTGGFVVHTQNVDFRAPRNLARDATVNLPASMRN